MKRFTYEDLWALVIVVILMLLALTAQGCAPPHAILHAEADFELRAPAFVFAGSSLRLTCFVPEKLGIGVIRLALEDVAVKGPQPLEHTQTFLDIAHVECGSWVATCQVMCEGGTRSATRVVEVRGCGGQGSPARQSRITSLGQ